jgi:hypothetical protein
LEKSIDKLDLEADNSISKVQEKANEVPPILTECCTDTLTGKISFKAPLVKGPKNKGSTISLEKRKGKKKSENTKGIDSINCNKFFTTY